MNVEAVPKVVVDDYAAESQLLCRLDVFEVQASHSVCALVDNAVLSGEFQLSDVECRLVIV